MKSGERLQSIRLVILWGLILTGGWMFPSASAVLAGPQGTPNSGVTQEMRVEANTFFQAQNWGKAAEAYEKITKLEPQNAGALYRLGTVYHSLKRFGEAAEAYERSVAVAANPVAYYNLACSYARNSNPDKALAALEKAASAGFTNVQRIKADEDFAALRETPRFKTALETIDRQARPCQFNAKHREFDFWIGDWNVQNQAGQQVGTNLVRVLEEGCMVQENWTGGVGGTGKSTNFFDPADGKWHQIWVSSGAGVAKYSGEFKDGAMRLTGEQKGATGAIVKTRMTFFPLAPDRVRQLAEQSTDDGKTWTTTVDFVYLRKK